MNHPKGDSCSSWRGVELGLPLRCGVTRAITRSGIWPDAAGPEPDNESAPVRPGADSPSFRPKEIAMSSATAPIEFDDPVRERTRSSLSLALRGAPPSRLRPQGRDPARGIHRGRPASRDRTPRRPPPRSLTRAGASPLSQLALEQITLQRFLAMSADDLRAILNERSKTELNGVENKKKRIAKNAQHNYVIIGAGPTGVEVAAMLGLYLKRVMKRHRLKNRHVDIYLIEASSRVLPTMSLRASKAAEKKLKKLGVQILTDTRVTSETGKSLKTSSGNIKTENVIWTAGAATNPFYAENSKHFMFNQRGKVRVDKHLQALPRVYVCGDNADTKFSGLALTAVWHADYIAKDLIARRKGKRAPAHTDRTPAQVVPVGGMAILQYRKIVLHGRLLSVVRRAADFIGYSDVLGPLKAFTIWSSSEKAEDSCHICKM